VEERDRPLLGRVEGRRKKGERVDKDLFDSVGEEFGISGTVASEIYYEHRGFWSEIKTGKRFRENLEIFRKAQETPGK
jgi:hypothetical protein